MRYFFPPKAAFIFIPLVSLLLIAAPVAAETTDVTATAGTQPLALDVAIAEAVGHNPGLAQTTANARELATRPSQAGALPDPILTLAALNVPTDTYNLDQEPMTQLQVGLSQKFPLFGKRGLRSQAASAIARAGESKTGEVRLDLIRNVKSTWWRLFYIDHSLTIVRRNKELLKTFVDISRTKYKVGQGLQQDVLLAQVEVSKLMDRQIQLQAKRRITEARLNVLLNRSVSQTITLPDDINTTLPLPPAETELQDIALENSPRIQAEKSRLDAAGTRLGLARKSYLPDLNLGISYGYRQGTNINGGDRPDFASVKLGINLPLYAGRKQSKQVDQQQAALIAQQQRFEGTRQQVAADIRSALANYNRSRRQAELFISGIIPQSQQTVSSMLAGYQVNKVDFLNLVRAQITLFNYETQYWQAVSEAHTSLAQLAATAGKETIYE